MRLDAVRLGLAGGILWGLSFFVLTIAAICCGYGVGFLNLLTSLYPGYAISWMGAFVGLVYGFVDGFIGFWLLGWLYNRLER